MIAAFHEEWFGEASQAVLASLVKDCSDIPGLLLEIGAWEGRSTCALANAAHPRTLHTVDTWVGSNGELSETLAARRDVRAQWQANVEHFTRGNVIAHQMGWREYVPTLIGPVAFAFIDAEHTYREVFDNVTALLPLMAPGGIICGDDVHHPPVREALTELFGSWKQAETLWIHKVPA